MRRAYINRERFVPVEKKLAERLHRLLDGILESGSALLIEAVCAELEALRSVVAVLQASKQQGKSEARGADEQGGGS
jgi:hypothetical protein